MASSVVVGFDPAATAGMDPSDATAAGAAGTANLVSFVLVPAALAVFLFYLFGDVGGGKARNLPVANPPTSLLEKATEKRPSLVLAGPAHLQEASKRFAGKAYRLVTHSGPMTILPPSMVGEVRNNAALDFRKLIKEDFPSALPGLEPFGILDRPDELLPNLVKKQLNKRLNTVTGALAMECSFSVNNELGVKADWTEADISPAVVDLVSRISSRIFLGQELCRNPEWLEITKEYTVMAMAAAQKLRIWPNFLWPVACRLYDEYHRTLAMKKRAQQLIGDLIKARRRERAECEAKGVPAPEYNDAVTWADQGAGLPFDPAVMQLSLSFVAIHTTSDLMSQMMFRLASDPETIQPIRNEIVEVLGAEGWSKQSLYKMKLMDSALKETQRVKPVSNLSLMRLALDNIELKGGVQVRKGDRLAVDAETTLKDPALYPEPEKFDIHRFHRMRESGGPTAEAKAQLVSTSPDFLAPFGYGKHACPGRFFAATEIKIMLVYMLLNYDWKLADPSGAASANIFFGLDGMLKPGTMLLYKSRTPELDVDSLEFKDAKVEE